MMQEDETIPIYCDPRLRERDTGPRTGRSFHDLDPHGDPDIWSPLLDSHAHVETFFDVATRARACLDDRETKHSDDVLAVVSHE
jgi:broad specificity phosphatase PhoE